jgi:hypothetical protein
MKKSTLWAVCVTVILILGFHQAGWGQPTLYEDFNYTVPGNIGGNTAASGTSNNNWTTHSNSLAGTIDVIANSLDYSGFASSTGNKVYIPGANGSVSRDVNRPAGLTAGQNTIYYSFLLNIVDNTQLSTSATFFTSGGNGYFIHMATTSGATAGNFYGRVGIRSTNSGTNFRLGIANFGNVFTEVTTDFSFGTTYLVVVKYAYTNPGTDVAYIWINPTSLGGVEPAGSFSNSSSTGNVSAFASNTSSICIRNSSNTPKAHIDEIRVGTTWADVTPAATTVIAPTVTTQTPTAIASTTATGNGTVTATGGANPTTHGFCWDLATNADPDITLPTKTVDNSAFSTGTFTGSITGLLANTSYKVRAYATNSAGTGYGSAVTFSTVSTPLITATTSTLTGFTYILGTGPSAESSYAIDGVNLTAPISIAPPTDYEISTATGVLFSATNPILLTPNGSGTVASTNIYVRLKAGLAVASYNNEPIVASSAGASNVSVACYGSVTAPVTTLTATPTSLTGFTYMEGAGPSTSKTYNLSGSYLTFPGDITITGSTDYEVSTDNTTFGGTATIALTSATLTSTPVYARLKAGLLTGTYNSEPVINSGGGAPSTNVVCNGTVTAAVPTITVTTITTFGTQPVGTSSAEKSYTVSGLALTADITITPPAGYEISLTTGSGFATTPIILTQTGGIVAHTTIYVRFTPPLVLAYSGNITNVSGTVTTNVAVSGTGVNTITDLPLYEGFAYTPPAYIGGNGSVAGTYSNNWTTHSVTAGQVTTVDVASGNLDYAGLATSAGNKLYLFSNANATSRDINRAFTASTANVMYYSALVNIVDASQLPTAVPDYFMHFGGAAGGSNTIFGARLGIKSTNATLNYRLSILNTSGGTSTWTDWTQDMNYLTTYLVVVKYDRSTTPTTASLWVNPISLGGTEPTGQVTNNIGTGAFAQFASICLRNSGTTPKANIDEIRVGATWADVTPAGAPTLAAVPTSLSGFVYFENAGPSIEQTFTINGTALSPTSGDLTVTGTTHFEVSSDGSTWGSTVTVPYIYATFTGATPVYVRLKAGFAPGTFNENITVSGGSATTIDVPCSGTVNANIATILVGSLTDFGNQAIGTLSAEQSYNVSGAYLTAPIVITPPAGFQISTLSGTGFSSTPINLTPISGTVASTPIYVKFAPALVQLYSGVITHTSGSAIQKDVAVSGTGIKGEPSNYPTNFIAGTVTQTTIPLTWTDAIGTTLPDGYIIKGSATGYSAIITPIDGTEIADDIDFSDGIAAKNVAQGVGSYTFAGLTPGLTYYFNIYPYTNSGTAINYKTVPPTPPQTSTSTLIGAPIDYHWVATGTASWTTASSWNPSRSTPAVNDNLFFDGGGSVVVTNVPDQIIGTLTVSANTTVALRTATSGKTLSIKGSSSGPDLVVQTGCALNLDSSPNITIALLTGATGSISGNMTLNGTSHKLTAVDPSGITFNSGSVFTTGASFSGNPFGVDNANSIIFSNGSTFDFISGSNPFGATAPGSTVVTVFETGSLYKQEGSNTPSFSGRTYANIEFNYSGIISVSGSTLASVDNITVDQGTVNFNLTTLLPGDPGHSIKGNITVATGAVLTFTPATAGTFTLNGSSAQSINVNGTLSAGSFSTIEISNAAGVTVNSPGVTPCSFNNLAITAGTFSFDATGTPGHSIKGNVTVVGGAALNFNPPTAGTVNFSGLSAQSISGGGTISGNALSTLAINNSAGLTLNADAALDGTLTLTSGLVTLGSNTLTLGATATISGTPSATNMIVATGTGELRKIFSGTGAFIYPVGDNDVPAEYSPVSLSFTSGSFSSAYAGVNLKNQGYLGITGDHLNRYWNITSSGISSFSCDAQFSYSAADVIGTESNIYCVLVNPPTNYSATNTTLHQLTANGITTFGTFTGREPLMLNKTLNIKAYLQGFYLADGTLQRVKGNTTGLPEGEFYIFTGPDASVADTLMVMLASDVAPNFSYTYEVKGVKLDINGNMSIPIPPAFFTGNYYIVLKHRNHLETWSATTVNFSGISPVSYDFTDAQSKAYGSNMINKTSPSATTVWALYGGDVFSPGGIRPQDGNIESADLNAIYNKNVKFDYGYRFEDLTGDSYVSSADLNIVYNNNVKFISLKSPRAVKSHK